MNNLAYKLPDTIISLKDVSLTFGSTVKALKSVTLDIERGKQVTIVGPSGSGKTSLLSVIAGKHKFLGKRDVKGRVGVIYQDLRLVKRLPALSNVLHGVLGNYKFIDSFFGFSKKDEEKAFELLKRVGLASKAYTPVFHLSGGEQQRVAIARALMSDPDILLADEPIAALDAETAEQVMSLLHEVAREKGITVISVHHDESLAFRVSDEVVRLRAGELIESWKCGAEEDEPEYRKVLEIIPEIEEPTPLVRRNRIIGIIVLCAVIYAWALYGIEGTGREFDGALSRLGDFVGAMIPDSFGEFAKIPWSQLFYSLLETLRMAFLGTSFGILLSVPLAALAIRSTGTSLVRRLIRDSIRLCLNVFRSVPSLLWGLIVTAVIGFGPLAGVIALSIYSVGYLTKFFYESFEGVDPKAPDALRDFGASGLQKFFHAVLPAALPGIVSSMLFMLEYNVRAATILGIIDAGGIGFYLKQYLDFQYLPAVTAGLLMIFGIVVVLDAVSARIRAKLACSC